MLKSRRTNRAQTPVLAIALCISMAPNVFLIERLVRRSAASSDMQPARQMPDLGARGIGGAGPINLSSTNPTNHVSPPFLWSQIESPDYRQYIANLRAVGCPEGVIQDVIAADLNQLYAARVAAIWKPKIQPYWQKGNHDRASPEQEKQLEALSHEKEAIFKDLLGKRVHDQELIDTLYLQVHGSEQELLFLPEERCQAALKVLEESGFEDKLLRAREREEYWDKREKFFDEKLKLLGKVLSPAELEDFKARNSQVADSLRTEAKYFNLSPEEFRSVMEARAQDRNGKDAGNLLNRSAATEEVRKLLGDKRAREFERVSDLFYINARRAAEEHGISLERAEAAWQVTFDARAEADKLGSQVELSPEVKSNQFDVIRIKAEKRLSDLLGENVSLPVRIDLRTALAAHQQEGHK